MDMRPLALTLCALVWAGPVGAEEMRLNVPGAELVKARCTLCHEAGHFVRLRQDRAAWEDTVELMIRRGAPIEPQEKPIILDYLVRHYGPVGAGR
ncbi:MAG: hypothetical protein NZ524_03045 [Thiobacillaceae bacterium]|nr:hypothetical protein [Thiobacillaceae bacterium]MCX7672981.1 hypothetical protein [Thiobacillaceae bacterium]MDW8324516.1 hypothetical protein [Burkholderiales bacterium]